MNSRTVIPVTTGDAVVPTGHAAPRRTRRRARGARLALGLALPPQVWQLAFFIGPLMVLLAMTCWSVQMFRLTPAQALGNWTHLLGASFFWDAYLYRFWVAGLVAVLASVLALPVPTSLARKVSPRLQRQAILLLNVTVFTIYPVRTNSRQIIFSPSGLLNSLLALIA